MVDIAGGGGGGRSGVRSSLYWGKLYTFRLHAVYGHIGLQVLEYPCPQRPGSDVTTVGFTSRRDISSVSKNLAPRQYESCIWRHSDRWVRIC
jgi:hypothetical protein